MLKLLQLKQNKFNLTNSAGNDLVVYCWSTDIKRAPTAIVQISHGMMEHANRYGQFAEYLVNNGYVVYANDHPGHGESANSDKDLGHFDGSKSWDEAVDSLYDLNDFIRKEHPGLPVFLFGHSMGSMLARHFAIQYGRKINGLIVSGTNYSPEILTNLGRSLSYISSKLRGSFHRDKLLFKLVVGDLNNKFKQARTGFDWLSSDPDEVDKYINDPLCGYHSTAGFYRGMFYGMGIVNNPKNIKKMLPDLPVLFVSGSNDPVGDFGKGVTKVYNLFQKSGMNKLSIRLYKDGRHEMLKEVNREEVMEDILEWIGQI